MINWGQRKGKEWQDQTGVDEIPIKNLRFYEQSKMVSGNTQENRLDFIYRCFCRFSYFCHYYHYNFPCVLQILVTYIIWTESVV